MRKPNLLARLRTKKSLRWQPKFGVCWNTEETWSRVNAEAIDPERFETTYAEWVTMAEAALQELIAAGLHPLKVLVDADELHAWCASHDKPNDAGSRAEFVAASLVRRRATLV